MAWSLTLDAPAGAIWSVTGHRQAHLREVVTSKSTWLWVKAVNRPSRANDARTSKRFQSLGQRRRSMRSSSVMSAVAAQGGRNYLSVSACGTEGASVKCVVRGCRPGSATREQARGEGGATVGTDD